MMVEAYIGKHEIPIIVVGFVTNQITTEEPLAIYYYKEAKTKWLLSTTIDKIKMEKTL